MKLLTSTTAAIFSSFFVALADATTRGDGGVSCPGSPSWQHAKCSMTVSFPSNTCAQVKEEIVLRLTQSSWIDPHNNGTYKLTSNSDGGTEAEVVTGERLTGDG
eukprot:718082_1